MYNLKNICIYIFFKCAKARPRGLSQVPRKDRFGYVRFGNVRLLILINLIF